MVLHPLSEHRHPLELRRRGDGPDGRLFLPFDARIGKKFSDLFNVSLEVGVPIIKQYPVYNFSAAEVMA